MASLSVNRSRMQFPNISSSTSYQWRPSLPDSGCKASNAGTAFGHVPSEDIRCKFQNLECSVHKMGMVLDSVQTDVMRLNKGMKDATLESNSTQKKAVVLERSLQEICKGQDDLKELVENCTKINPDQLNVMNSHSSNLDEISLTLSAWPKQMQADLRLLQSDISSVLAEEMQGIVRAIKSFESRPAAIERPSCTIDKRPLMNPVPEVIEKPLVNQTEMKGTSMVSTILIANKRSPLNQTLVVNERSVVNQKPLANGRSLMIQKPAKGRPQKQNPVASGQLTYSQRTYRNPQKSRMPPTKLLPTHLVCPPIEANSNLDIEQGKVKAVRQNLTCSISSLAPEQGDMSNRQVTHQLTEKEPVCMTIDSDENSQGCVSSMIMNTETADAESHMRKEAAEESLRILKRPMKRRGDKKAIIPVKAVSKTARASDETGSGLCKRNSGRDRRPSIRFHGPDWYR